MGELGAALAGHVATGPAGGVYDNQLFTGGRGSMVVYRPVSQPPASGRVRPVTLPAAELAITLHQGAQIRNYTDTLHAFRLFGLTG
jgi:hypothetical protein